MKGMKKIATIFLITSFAFLTLAPITKAKADDIIIDYTGAISIVITNNSVLATETTNPTPHATTAPTPATPAPKIIPIVPPNTNTTVKISPNTDKDNKLKITIETKSTAASKTQTIEKTADNVILRGPDKQPVLSIKPDQKQKNELNIQQKNVNATTTLPLQVDTKTHVVSVQTSSGTQPVSILPDQALQGTNDKVSTKLQATKSDLKLTSENGKATYVVSQERKGKVFGTFNLTFPSQVKISATDGKTISIQQSPFSFLFGSIIR